MIMWIMLDSLGAMTMLIKTTVQCLAGTLVDITI